MRGRHYHINFAKSLGITIYAEDRKTVIFNKFLVVSKGGKTSIGLIVNLRVQYYKMEYQDLFEAQKSS